MNPGSELNAAIAREVMGWTSLGAHLWQDATGTVYYTGDDPQRVFVPHVVFDPSRDALYAVWVEEQLRRVGRHAAYVAALIAERAPDQATPLDPAVQVLLDAAPAQRCRAALKVVRDAG